MIVKRLHENGSGWVLNTATGEKKWIPPPTGSFDITEPPKLTFPKFSDN